MGDGKVLRGFHDMPSGATVFIFTMLYDLSYIYLYFVVRVHCLCVILGCSPRRSTPRFGVRRAARMSMCHRSACQCESPLTRGSSRAARSCHCAVGRLAATAAGVMQGLQRSMSGKQAEARGGRTLDAIALGLELGEHNRHFGQRLFQARYADVS